MPATKPAIADGGVVSGGDVGVGVRVGVGVGVGVGLGLGVGVGAGVGVGVGVGVRVGVVVYGLGVGEGVGGVVVAQPASSNATVVKTSSNIRTILFFVIETFFYCGSILLR